MNIIPTILFFLTILIAGLWLFSVPKSEKAVQGVIIADLIWLLWDSSHLLN